MWSPPTNLSVTRNHPKCKSLAFSGHHRAEHKGGGMLRKLDRSKPGPTNKDTSHDVTYLSDNLASLNLDRMAAHRWQVMSWVPEGVLEEYFAKLTEQRKFVLWWDEQEKHPGNRKGVVTTDLKRPKAQDFGLDRGAIHRWRKRLKAPETVLSGPPVVPGTPCY